MDLPQKGKHRHVCACLFVYILYTGRYYVETCDNENLFRVMFILRDLALGTLMTQAQRMETAQLVGSAIQGT